MMNKIRFVYTFVAVFAAVAPPFAYAQSAAIDQARQKIGEADAALKAAMEAQQAGEMQAAMEKSKQGQSLLSEARDLYAAAGVETTEDVIAYSQLLLRLGDYDLVEEVVLPALNREVETVDPANVQPSETRATLWLLLGQSLAAQGSARLQDATQAFHRAAEASEETETAANALASLALVFVRHGHYELAQENAANAAELVPDHVIASAVTASCALRNGQIKEAAGLFDTVSATPQGTAIVPELIQAGLQNFEATRQTFPDTAENHFAYARILIRGNRLQECALALERALALDPANYIAWNMAGGVYQQLNYPAKAIEAYEHSLELQPDQDRTRQMLNALQSAAQPSAPGTAQ